MFFFFSKSYHLLLTISKIYNEYELIICGGITMALTDTYKLNNGVEIPVVGFGTWQTPDGDVARESVKTALEVGYRHIDTAAAYGNEVSVGQGIKESGVNRHDIFLTTKLWNDSHGYEATKKAIDLSLQKLDTDYLDLYLIHWPNPVSVREHWAELNAEKLASYGRSR